MTQPQLRRYDRWFLHLVVCAVCCGAAFGVRRVVAADTLDDLPALGLQGGVVIAIIGAVAFLGHSAGRLTGTGERVLARVAAAILLLVGAAFVQASYADATIALHALASDRADPTPTQIVLGPTGRDVRLTGDLKEGAARRLGALLDAHPKVARIHLTSDGGLADEGEALRQVIAAHRLTTFVPDYCVSACTIAFLGGRQRLVMDGARLGFHAPYEEGLFGQTFPGDVAAERADYVAAGAAPDFVDEAMKVGPTDIWTPDPDELLDAHVITGVVDRYRFPDSNLDGNADPSGARDVVLRNFPLVRALGGWRPKAVDAIAAWYLDAYRSGLSEGQVVDGLKAVVGGAAASALAAADDDTLLGLGRYLVAALQAADSDDACVAVGEQADLLAAESLLDHGDGGGDKIAVALLARALRTRHAATATSAPVPFWRATAAVATRIALDDGTPHACAEMRGLYADILRLPRADAAAVIRAIVARGDHISPLAQAVVDGRD